MSKDRKSFFWASYADLMTSLFFVMVVLFILTFIELESFGISPKQVDMLRRELDLIKVENDSLTQYVSKINLTIDSLSLKMEGLNSQLQIKDDSLAMILTSESELKVIREIEAATRNLDSRYFAYSEEHKKHRIKLEVKFEQKKSSMDHIPQQVKAELVEVGKILNDFINEKVAENNKIQYLLIIEGQASKLRYSRNYELSYERALSLVRFWDANGIRFENKNCEVLISGGGDGQIPGTGSMRDEDEHKNQRFLIHILPKPGVIK